MRDDVKNDLLEALLVTSNLKIPWEERTIEQQQREMELAERLNKAALNGYVMTVSCPHLGFGQV